MYQHFLLGNKSIIGVLIASFNLFIIAGVVVNFQKKADLFTKIILCVLLLVGICFLLQSNGRAAWLGFVVSVVYLHHKLPFIPKLPQKMSLKLVLFVLVLAGLLFWLKKDSSYGRVLVYKISANIFRENWMSGVGLGRFKVQYNLYQSSHFSSRDIDNKEALLADNTFYAFNDIWQLLIEIGVIRFISLLLFVTLVLRHFKCYSIKVDKAYLFYGASAALLCIAVASLFFYPFRIFGLQLLTLTFLLIMLFSLQVPSKQLFVEHWALKSARILCCASLFFLLYYGYSKLSFLQRSKDTFDLARAGFKTKALQSYASIQPLWINDGTAMYSYAKELYSANRLTEAKLILSEARKHYSGNELYHLSASIAYEEGDYEQAEKDYLTALYMVPNRMKSRYELFNFYLNVKDTAKAIYWGNSLLNMPVKIPSHITKTLRQRTKQTLSTLTQQVN